MEELYHWLMSVVDSLPLEEKYKDQAFKAAFDHVANCLMVRPAGFQYAQVHCSIEIFGLQGFLVWPQYTYAERKRHSKPIGGRRFPRK